MSKLPDLLHVNIAVTEENYTTTVPQILSQIHPRWNGVDVQIKRMSEGFVNLLLLCSIKDSDEEEKVMVRVFGENQGLNQCFDRESEVNVMRVLAHEKVITSLFCRFENGVVYGFAPGNTLQRSVLLEDKMRRLICKGLHKLHSTDLKAYLGEVPRPGLLVFMDRPWEVILQNDYSQIEQQERYKENLPPLCDLQKIQTEMHVLYDELSSLYPVVYCHADCHLHNMVYCPQTDSLCLVDWEGANWCPEIMDPTILFDRHVTLEDEFGTEENRRQLLESYLATHPLHGRDGAVSKKLLDQWYRDSVRASMVTCFNIVSFCLACIKTSPKEADFLAFAIMFYIKFNRYREEAQKIHKC